MTSRLLAGGALVAVLVALAAPAFADSRKHACLRALDAMDVEYRQIKKPGMHLGVEVRGPIAGVEYASFGRKPLVLDCSLVYSLARAAIYLRAAGISKMVFSSAYQRRRVRRSKNLSQHSFGLALDVHQLEGDVIGKLEIKDDFEQGLGDDDDCIGTPLTEPGARLRRLYCQLEQSQLFRSILSPDFDAHHYNHFHLEALGWEKRTDAVAPGALRARRVSVSH